MQIFNEKRIHIVFCMAIRLTARRLDSDSNVKRDEIIETRDCITDLDLY